MSTVLSFCRICNNNCSIAVDVVDGRAVRVKGNADNPVYRGYTCVKGRSQPQFLVDERRLLHSRRRVEDSFVDVPVEQAMDEIAAELRRIVDEHGPRAVAGYAGTMALGAYPTGMPMFTALLDAVGTPMRFDPNTLDKGGKQIAASMLGRWGAPSQGFDRPDAILLLGINPLVTYTGFPAGSPHTWLADAMRRGCQLIVIDPRRTETARKATLYLQPHPGHDAQMLAAMINVVLSEGLYDVAFVEQHVRNLEALRASVESFQPIVVAERAGVDADALVRAARVYASAPRGYAMAGTGPNMSGGGSLIEYLVLVLETLCGRWLREGEVMHNAATLVPGPIAPRAEATDPSDWRLPELMRVRGLQQSSAGMPLAALPDEMLQPGEGQVRALISWGGNPAVVFPDQRKTAAALDSLELLVQIDPWPSATADRAHYVIATTMPLEAASMTSLLDSLAVRATGYGLGAAYAQYTPAVSARPDGAELVEDWEFFYGLLTRLGHPVSVRPAGSGAGTPLVTLGTKPTTDELLELLAAGARVPLETVKDHPGGALFGEDLPVVGPPGPGGPGRLDVGNGTMLAALAGLRGSVLLGTRDADFPLRLLCRRHDHTYNTTGKPRDGDRGVKYNPAFVHPAELARLGLKSGAVVRIRSATASIPAIVQADLNLREGLVSMAFGYGPAADDASDVAAVGSSPNKLIPNDDVFDPYTGQPRMSNVPVVLEPLT